MAGMQLYYIKANSTLPYTTDHPTSLDKIVFLRSSGDVSIALKGEKHGWHFCKRDIPTTNKTYKFESSRKIYQSKFPQNLIAII